MTTDITEKGLEELIEHHLITVNGYEKGDHKTDYNPTNTFDEKRLIRFLKETQNHIFEAKNHSLDDPKTRQKLFERINTEIEKRGVISVLRNGIELYPYGKINLYTYLPSERNPKAKQNFDKNIFSVTRQLHYSTRTPVLSIDMGIFINGLPLITLELKNNYTHQNVDSAIRQYKIDRDPKEPLLHHGRCIVHFAVDDMEIAMCSKLDGKKSRFLPFNKGRKDGAGNPPNPSGLKTSYLWEDILTKTQLADIIENYAQMIEKGEAGNRKTKTQIFPRYHQLSVVRELLSDAKQNGIGQKYLIQHSAGSGKSNSIAWLAFQLIPLEKDGKPLFDSVLVVTDRKNLDKQIKGTIKGFSQLKNIIGHAEKSSDLKTFLAEGKKIIITTVHKFPYILDQIGTEQKDKNFAIIIDEAHSSQSGRMSASMNLALNDTVHNREEGKYVGEDQDDEESIEDKINRIIEGKKMVKNASYFAFTATPKNKTLEMFGVPFIEDGKTKHRPFHQYTMKQAIQEGFILDVLQNYTPVKSYFHLIKTIEDDPKFDKKKALKKLKTYVERNEYTIAEKSKIIVNHFIQHVAVKIHGKARAMVVCKDIETAITYFHEIQKELKNQNSQYKAIIAFSGEKEIKSKEGGDPKKVTESSLNGFPSSTIEDMVKTDPYRILVVANKFQTGYDEPLLHTMYVDKGLADVKAVQTLSRLNRAMSGKFDTCVLDFFNDVDEIKEAFDRYYKTTILADETDPNKLYDLLADIQEGEIFSDEDVEIVVERFLNAKPRETIDPILDQCTDRYKDNLDLDAQIKVKGSAKTYLRTYSFLAAILPYGNTDWEKYYIFLTLLVPKLPTPKEEDLAKGIINHVDLDSYRVEVLDARKIELEDENAEIQPVPTKTPKRRPDPEMEILSNIIAVMNDTCGDIEWKDKDKVAKDIAELPKRVLQDELYLNAMKNSDRENARIECERVIKETIGAMFLDNLELYKQFCDNTSFKKRIESMVFNLTYNSNNHVDV